MPHYAAIWERRRAGHGSEEGSTTDFTSGLTVDHCVAGRSRCNGKESSDGHDENEKLQFETKSKFAQRVEHSFAAHRQRGRQPKRREQQRQWQQ